VPVSEGAPEFVVVFGVAGLRDSSKRPDVADCGQAIVFNPPMDDRGAVSGRASGRYGASDGLQSAGVGEASRVVTDLGEDVCAGAFAEAWKARDDPVIATLAGCLYELEAWLNTVSSVDYTKAEADANPRPCRRARPD